METKVCIISDEWRANHKVCFVECDHLQKNHKLIADGKLVKYESEANIKVYMVNLEHQADILITQKNFPKG